MENDQENYLDSIALKSIFKRSQLGILLLGIGVLFALLSVVTIWSFNTYLNRNVNLLGKTLSELIQPAIVFKDENYIQKYLESYLNSYSIRRIEVLDENQQVLIMRENQAGQYTLTQTVLERYLLDKPKYFDVFHDDNRKIATIVLYPSGEQMAIYLVQLIVILLFYLFLMMIAWVLSVQYVYRKIMNTIKPLIHTAELVHDQKAYNLRFKESRIYEFNILIQVFNQLLTEIQKWHVRLLQENEQLSYQANHDELTGLPNRHVFYRTLNEIFADEVEREQSVLMFIDNNNFKQINDQYGHQAGDAVLKEMAIRLKGRIRQQDLMVRIGGDEFAIVLHGVKKIDYLPNIAENLLNCCQEPLLFEQQTIYFSFSIGMAYSSYAHSMEQWIEQADSAMYQAKELDSHWSIFEHK